MRRQAAVRSRCPGPSGMHTLREPVKGGRGGTPGYQEAGREGGPAHGSQGLGGIGRLGLPVRKARRGPILCDECILHKRASDVPEWFSGRQGTMAGKAPDTTSYPAGAKVGPSRANGINLQTQTTYNDNLVEGLTPTREATGDYSGRKSRIPSTAPRSSPLSSATTS